MTPQSKMLQALRFMAAGIPGVILYYLILYFLTDIIGVWYMVSAVIASFFNYGSNFILQKFWAFENKNTKTIKDQAFKYTVMVVSLFVANLLILYIFVDYFHFWYLSAQIVATIIVTIISYLISRRIFVQPPAFP